MKNLNLVDVSINSSHNKVGVLFGYLVDSSISNVNLNTSSQAKTNLVTGNSTQYCGGIVGYSCRVSFSNIKTENTFVKFPSCDQVGGITGYSESSNITDCHVIGFPSNSSAEIVRGYYEVGGISGIIVSQAKQTIVRIERTGVVQGLISAYKEVGSIFGEVVVNNQVFLSQCYSKRRVVVSCSSLFAGGLFGYFYIITSTTIEIKDSYSMSSVIGSGIYF